MKEEFSVENNKTFKNAKAPLIFEGIEFIKIEEGDGNIELGLEVKESMMNPNGILHGGMIYTLADMCAGLGAYALGYEVSTIEGGINFLRPTTKGKIVAKNDVKHIGRNTIVSNVDIKNNYNKLIATGIFTMAVIGPAN